MKRCQVGKPIGSVGASLCLAGELVLRVVALLLVPALVLQRAPTSRRTTERAGARFCTAAGTRGRSAASRTQQR